MVLENKDTLTINIKVLKETSSEQLVLLYFSGDDTYLNHDVLKSIGFGYTTNLDLEAKSWQLIIPVSSIAAKIDLIRMHFPAITIIKQ